MINHLLAPIRLGARHLKHRGVMAPLNAADVDTYYQGGECGYLDYPTLSA